MTSYRTPVTLAAVMATLEADATLAASRRRDLRSALQRVAGMTGKPVDRSPTDLALLRPMLNAIQPAAHGISAKTFANLRSNLMPPVRRAGIVEARLPALTPAWQAFYAALPTKRLRHGLSRFLRWCALHRVSCRRPSTKGPWMSSPTGSRRTS